MHAETSVIQHMWAINNSDTYSSMKDAKYCKTVTRQRILLFILAALLRLRYLIVLIFYQQVSPTTFSQASSFNIYLTQTEQSQIWNTLILIEIDMCHDS